MAQLRPLIGPAQIRRRIRHLADRITDDYAERDLLVLPLLGGAFCFVADLVRQIHHPDLQLHFAAASSYHGGTHSSGTVQLRDLPDCRDRQVLVVDDILDTGRTLDAVLAALAAAGATGLASCVLLDKPARRLVERQADYVGFTIPDRFVVGYGLDHGDRYRHLPGVFELLPDAPDSTVS